jgi:hypothetical protein
MVLNHQLRQPDSSSPSATYRFASRQPVRLAFNLFLKSTRTRLLLPPAKIKKKITAKHKTTPDAPLFRASLASISKFDKNRRSTHIILSH